MSSHANIKLDVNKAYSVAVTNTVALATHREQTHWLHVWNKPSQQSPEGLERVQIEQTIALLEGEVDTDDASNGSQ